jgi:hypothetical protein
LGKVKITVSVDWDADCSFKRFVESLETEIGEFNKGATAIVGKAVPMTHFICPAFYLRDPSIEQNYTDVINKYLRPVDEVGLHIHCWESLVEAALGNGKYKNAPSAFQGGEPGQNHDNVSDRGQGIPLGAYDTDDIEALLKYGNALLGKLALDQTVNKGAITSFRCGGWFTNDDVFEALERCNFTHEASAVACDLLESSEYLAPMAEMLAKLWRADTTHLQPKSVKNKARRTAYPDGVVPSSQPRLIGKLVAVPNTGVLAEYTTAKIMTAHVHDATSALADLPKLGVQDLYVSLGFHHNNNSGWPRLLKAIENITDAFGKDIEFIATKDVPPIIGVMRLRGG